MSGNSREQPSRGQEKEKLPNFSGPLMSEPDVQAFVRELRSLGKPIKPYRLPDGRFFILSPDVEKVGNTGKGLVVNNKGEVEYFGDLKDGKMDGRGVMFDSIEGSVYTGAFFDDEPRVVTIRKVKGDKIVFGREEKKEVVKEKDKIDSPQIVEDSDVEPKDEISRLKKEIEKIQRTADSGGDAGMAAFAWYADQDRKREKGGVPLWEEFDYHESDFRKFVDRALGQKAAADFGGFISKREDYPAVGSSKSIPEIMKLLLAYAEEKVTKEGIKKGLYDEEVEEARDKFREKIKSYKDIEKIDLVRMSVVDRHAMRLLIDELRSADSAILDQLLTHLYISNMVDRVEASEDRKRQGVVALAEIGFNQDDFFRLRANYTAERVVSGAEKKRLENGSYYMGSGEVISASAPDHKSAPEDMAMVRYTEPGAALDEFLANRAKAKENEEAARDSGRGATVVATSHRSIPGLSRTHTGGVAGAVTSPREPSASTVEADRARQMEEAKRKLYTEIAEGRVNIIMPFGLDSVTMQALQALRDEVNTPGNKTEMAQKFKYALVDGLARLDMVYSYDKLKTAIDIWDKLGFGAWVPDSLRQKAMVDGETKKLSAKPKIVEDRKIALNISVSAEANRASTDIKKWLEATGGNEKLDIRSWNDEGIRGWALVRKQAEEYEDSKILTGLKKAIRGGLDDLKKNKYRDLRVGIERLEKNGFGDWVSDIRSELLARDKERAKNLVSSIEVCIDEGCAKQDILKSLRESTHKGINDKEIQSLISVIAANTLPIEDLFSVYPWLLDININKANEILDELRNKKELSRNKHEDPEIITMDSEESRNLNGLFGVLNERERDIVVHKSDEDGMKFNNQKLDTTVKTLFKFLPNDTDKVKVRRMIMDFYSGVGIDDLVGKYPWLFDIKIPEVKRGESTEEKKIGKAHNAGEILPDARDMEEPDLLYDKVKARAKKAKEMDEAEKWMREVDDKDLRLNEIDASIGLDQMNDPGREDIDVDELPDDYSHREEDDSDFYVDSNLLGVTSTPSVRTNRSNTPDFFTDDLKLKSKVAKQRQIETSGEELPDARDIVVEPDITLTFLKERAVEARRAAELTAVDGKTIPDEEGDDQKSAIGVAESVSATEAEDSLVDVLELTFRTPGLVLSKEDFLNPKYQVAIKTLREKFASVAGDPSGNAKDFNSFIIRSLKSIGREIYDIDIDLWKNMGIHDLVVDVKMGLAASALPEATPPTPASAPGGQPSSVWDRAKRPRLQERVSVEVSDISNIVATGVDKQRISRENMEDYGIRRELAEFRRSLESVLTPHLGEQWSNELNNFYKLMENTFANAPALQDDDTVWQEAGVMDWVRFWRRESVEYVPGYFEDRVFPKFLLGDKKIGAPPSPEKLAEYREHIHVTTPLGTVDGRTNYGGLNSKYKDNQDSQLVVMGRDGSVGVVTIDVAGGSALVNPVEAPADTGDVIGSSLTVSLLENTEVSLTSIVEEAHSQMKAENDRRIGLPHGDPDKWNVEGCYACVATARINPDYRVEVVSVGDSIGLTVRGGEVFWGGTTNPQNFAWLGSGGTYGQEFYTSPVRNRIFATVGSNPGPGPESRTFQAEDEDQIILASDGIWDNISPYEVARLCKTYKGRELQEVIYDLAYDRQNYSPNGFKIEYAPGRFVEIKGSSMDNITVQVIDVKYSQEFITKKQGILREKIEAIAQSGDSVQQIDSTALANEINKLEPKVVEARIRLIDKYLSGDNNKKNWAVRSAFKEIYGESIITAVLRDGDLSIIEEGMDRAVFMAKDTENAEDTERLKLYQDLIKYFVNIYGLDVNTPDGKKRKSFILPILLDIEKAKVENDERHLISGLRGLTQAERETLESAGINFSFFGGNKITNLKDLNSEQLSKIDEIIKINVDLPNPNGKMGHMQEILMRLIENRINKNFRVNKTK